MLESTRRGSDVQFFAPACGSIGCANRTSPGSPVISITRSSMSFAGSLRSMNRSIRPAAPSREHRSLNHEYLRMSASHASADLSFSTPSLSQRPSTRRCDPSTKRVPLPPSGSFARHIRGVCKRDHAVGASWENPNANSVAARPIDRAIRET
jgi:hypothetical protein